MKIKAKKRCKKITRNWYPKTGIKMIRYDGSIIKLQIPTSKFKRIQESK